MRRRRFLGFIVLLTLILGNSSCRETPAPKLQKKPDFEIRRLTAASQIPKLNQPVAVLLLGSDSRSEDFGGRSDAIILAYINPATRRAALVSFPRDSRLAIPGRGVRKINDAMAFGGPQLAARAIESYSGIKINYYAAATFKGFIRMIDRLGGLQITIEKSINDRWAGAFLPAGAQRLNGGQVLAYSRARHIPGGDFSRAAHQQHILVALFEQLSSYNSPFDMLNYISIFSGDSLTNLTAKDLFLLGGTILSLRKESIERTVLKGSTASIGGGSYVILDESSARQVFARLKTL